VSHTPTQAVTGLSGDGSGVFCLDCIFFVFSQCIFAMD
jgi:hypothetical protein